VKVNIINLNYLVNTHFEKRPNYPVYRLPFKGDSVYRDSFVNNLKENQRKKAYELNCKMTSPSRDPNEIKLKLSMDHLKQQYAGIKFEGRQKMIDPSKLMNNDLYKTKSMRPMIEEVVNIPAPNQYATMYRDEFIKKPMIKRKNVKPKIPLW
jgi:hypothetical protein